MEKITQFITCPVISALHTAAVQAVNASGYDAELPTHQCWTVETPLDFEKKKLSQVLHF